MLVTITSYSHLAWDGNGNPLPASGMVNRIDCQEFTATGFESTEDRDAWRDNSYTSQGLQRIPDAPE